MNFEDRKAKWAKRPRRRNDDLSAGSPMYYYCRFCGAEMVLPEDHQEPAPKICPECLNEGRRNA